jgi:hypothetical protein
MIQPRPLAPEPPLTEPHAAPVPHEPIWPQLAAERQKQARLILAQMLLQAANPQVQHREGSHEQPE